MGRGCRVTETRRDAKLISCTRRRADGRHPKAPPRSLGRGARGRRLSVRDPRPDDATELSEDRLEVEGQRPKRAKQARQEQQGLASDRAEGGKHV